MLYLPSYATARMTDIWRSFVTQRVAGEYGWHVLFRSADMVQERNEHDLMRDFEDEVPGYLGNQKIVEVLDALTLSRDLDSIGNNLRTCYEALVAHSLLPKEELHLVDAWLDDLSDMGSH